MAAQSDAVLQQFVADPLRLFVAKPVDSSSPAPGLARQVSDALLAVAAGLFEKYRVPLPAKRQELVDALHSVLTQQAAGAQSGNVSAEAASSRIGGLAEQVEPTFGPILAQLARQVIGPGVTVRRAPPEGRWVPTNVEVEYLQRVLADRSRRGRLDPPTRLSKVLEALKLGPIRQTEDVVALTRRGQLAEGLALMPALWPGFGWREAQFAPQDPRLPAFGKRVHDTVERMLRLERTFDTLIFDNVVSTPAGFVPLRTFADADPAGDDTLLRLRVAHEAFQVYRGDETRPNYDLRADLIDATTLELWEIKPLRSIGMAAIQSWLYKARYNIAWQPYSRSRSDRSAGFLRWGAPWLGMPRQLKLDADHIAVVASSALPGLIVYQVFERTRRDRRQKAEPQIERVVIEELVRKWLEGESKLPVPVVIPALPGIPIAEPATVPATPGGAPRPLAGGASGAGQGTPKPANDNEEVPLPGESTGERAAKVALAILMVLLAFLLLRFAPPPPTPQPGGPGFGPFFAPAEGSPPMANAGRVPDGTALSRGIMRAMALARDLDDASREGSSEARTARV